MDVVAKEILMKMKNELVTIRMLLEHQTAALERQVKLDHRDCPFCAKAEAADFRHTGSETNE